MTYSLDIINLAINKSKKDSNNYKTNIKFIDNKIQ